MSKDPTYVNSLELGCQGQLTLDTHFYCSDSLFKHEMQKIFQSSWLCIGHESQLPEHGSFVTKQWLNESILIVRSDSGKVSAFHNLCRHRGTLLCYQPQGNTGSSIRCPYHAWTYSLDGKLIGVPDEKSFPALDRDQLSLHTIQTARWNGLIWISLKPTVQPNFTLPPNSFDTFIQPLAERFNDWNLSNLSVAGQTEYIVEANWKLILQNYSECYHCSPVHPSLVKLSRPTSGGNDLLNGPILGGYMDIKPPHQTLSTTGICTSPILAPTSEANEPRAYYYVAFPQTMISFFPDYVMLHTLWPESRNRTRIDCYWLFDRTKETASESEPSTGPNFSEAIEFWDQVNREDWLMSELSQKGIQSSRYIPGPYSNRESMAALLDRYYLQQLQQFGISTSPDE